MATTVVSSKHNIVCRITVTGHASLRSEFETHLRLQHGPGRVHIVQETPPDVTMYIIYPKHYRFTRKDWCEFLSCDHDHFTTTTVSCYWIWKSGQEYGWWKIENRVYQHHHTEAMPQCYLDDIEYVQCGLTAFAQEQGLQ